MSEEALAKISIPTVAAGLAKAGFDSIEAVAEAKVEDLVVVKGIAEKSAELLIKKAKAELAGGGSQTQAERPEEEAPRRSISGLGLGRIVLYRDPRTQGPVPAVVVEVYDATEGEIGIVCLHAPRPTPGGGRSAATFARATRAHDSQSPALGEWTWPPRA